MCTAFGNPKPYNIPLLKGTPDFGKPPSEFRDAGSLMTLAPMTRAPPETRAKMKPHKDRV